MAVAHPAVELHHGDCWTDPLIRKRFLAGTGIASGVTGLVVIFLTELHTKKLHRQLGN
jgi:hypothetical protein